MLSRISRAAVAVAFACVLSIGFAASSSAVEEENGVGFGNCKCLPESPPPVVFPICYTAASTALVYMAPPPTYVQVYPQWCRQNAQFFWLSFDEYADCYNAIACLCSNPAPGPEAGSCTDGVDNDCDGDVDCDDLDCMTDPACSGGTGTGTGD